QVRESEAMDREALAKRGMVESERQLIPRSGETRLALVRRVPLYGEDGEPQLLISISDDITDRKRSEAQRLAREIELRKPPIREASQRTSASRGRVARARVSRSYAVCFIQK